MMTSFYGKNICNLLCNLIIEEFNSILESHLTSIRVTFNGQFYVLNGETTILYPINYSKIFREYFEDKSINIYNFNVIDLINYNKKPIKNNLYLNLNHKKRNFIDLEIIDDVDLQGHYLIDDNIKIIRTNNKKLYNRLIENKLYHDYGFLDYFAPFPFISDEFFGLSLTYEKVYETYLKYISYNVFEKQLCKEINYTISYNGDIGDLTWETMTFKVDCVDPFVSTKWIESMILDLFDFNYNNIIEHLSLDKYNFENEIISNNRCWMVRDKTKDMIII